MADTMPKASNRENHIGRRESDAVPIAARHVRRAVKGILEGIVVI